VNCTANNEPIDDVILWGEQVRPLSPGEWAAKEAAMDEYFRELEDNYGICDKNK